MIKDSSFKIISGHDQRELYKKDDIIEELFKNIYLRHNWFETMKKLIAMGEKNFLECGPGKSLYKSAKFIEGDYYFYTLKNLESIL